MSGSKSYKPYVSPNDPCDPIKEKSYQTPPHLYMGLQKKDLEQYSPEEALKKGTLWPALFDSYKGFPRKTDGKESNR
ncbi:spore coat associated protein CotJA [Pseudalkalibacillus caeni]|uniref:Spore coat associated protein CotJA n=1 Tax=Exobacillus caeni TaxID=2574798 RepID=A0A5R9F1Y1_9BACL|nr:spore coat associated protein CotJA [Pseudalkalibacillus caeni]TLS35468.1 spore coat associated protein CotJA [Pseudalkalibacillus caeni]